MPKKTPPKPRPRGRPPTTGSRGWPTLGTRIPPALLADLRRTAEITESTVAQVVIDAVREHCEGLLALHGLMSAATALDPGRPPADDPR